LIDNNYFLEVAFLPNNKRSLEGYRWRIVREKGWYVPAIHGEPLGGHEHERKEG
jgi:hypothetical protein